MLGRRLASGTELVLNWTYYRNSLREEDLPCDPIPVACCMSACTNRVFGPLTCICLRRCPMLSGIRSWTWHALYQRRWEGEIDYRHLKTTLEMEEFAVKTPAMFQKELAAGLLTYNLICAWITKAALAAGLTPQELSFSRCAAAGARFPVPRSSGVGGTGAGRSVPAGALAQCRLPHQPNKVRHEPRKVRQRARSFRT